MTTPTTTTPLLPNLQQQQQQQSGDIEPNSNNASAASGSIGPFFVVISVLTILAIVSCILGRICTRGKAMTETSPLDSIMKERGCLGWFKRKCRCCFTGDVEVGAKVMASGEDHGKPQELPAQN